MMMRASIAKFHQAGSTQHVKQKRVVFTALVETLLARGMTCSIAALLIA